MVWRRSRSWARCEAVNWWQERDAAFLLLLRRTSILGDPWRKWNYRLHSLLQETRGDGGQEFPQVTYGRAKYCSWWATQDHKRKSHSKSWMTWRWSGYTSTLFPGRLSVRFPCISKPRTVLLRRALQESQGNWVLSADLDRDQTSRLLEERIE